MSPKTKTVSSKPVKSRKNRTAHTVAKFILLVVKFIIIVLVALSSAAAGIAGGALLAWINRAEPITPDQLILSGYTSYVYDSEGNIIIPLQGSKNREQIDYKDIPQDLKDALVAIEDKRFYDHFGVDLKRTSAAVLNFVKSGGSTGGAGGSTITQQVVKNLTGKDRRSVERKVQEWWTAMHLERNLGKDQILNTYMNLIYMGENCYGVQAASKTYFNKNVSDLSLAECASLAGITNLPGKYDPFTTKGRENNIERQKIILKEMLEQEYISQKEYDEAIEEELKFADSNKRDENFTSNQSYFIDQVVYDVKKDLMAKGYSEELAIKTIYNDGIKIYTTQDTKIQKAMDEVFLDENKYFSRINKKTTLSPQAAMVIIDPWTGHVKALYGGAGKKTGAPLNLASSSLMKRTPGSTFKPITVYGPAVNEGLITAATIVDDSPAYMQGENKPAYPMNYDRKYSGLMSIRDAITDSVNVVAAKVWRDYVGPTHNYLNLQYLKKVNINRDNEKYVSVALGAPYDGVNPLQMAAAYVPFVNKGLYLEPITYTKVLDMKGNVLLEKESKTNVVYGEAAAYVMVDMLRDVVRDGTAATYGKVLGGKMPSAGKTGTTSNNYDKWFVGFTPYYVGSVWYGYGKNITLLSTEYDRAQRIWHDVMDKVHKELPIKDFVEPEGIVRRTICKYSGKIATDLCAKDPRGSAVRSEIFIKGTEPFEDDLCKVHVKATVCKDSKDTKGRNLFAGDYCPYESLIEKVFIKRPVPYVPLKPDEKSPADIIYELPEGEYCNIHGPETNELRDDTLFSNWPPFNRDIDSKDPDSSDSGNISEDSEDSEDSE
ncbi:MAG: PBP1A family penicillin-binding protein [Clostridiaceae bacterium]|nr:PBP1A family penicillin-binding protein [Clostridiaceae bacterium]